ncbi:hypothetical protein EIP91_004709 [Steccherinum ochraceum]|uniref:Uncharacterized protein n=1 Tax=Steccherinum ochraceum TaxID=92696 RepID=A0A4R0RAW7_9APHY|nr:hypothetical protein EIP91_004709 [Steccherinum ochraceum]
MSCLRKFDSGLGVCLSDLVAVPVASGTSTPTPLPTVSGIDTPTTQQTTSSNSRPLTWWEILLMALGCAFIFIVILMIWRRHARKKRAQATAKFAAAKRLHDKSGWRWKLARFGERLFGHKSSPKARYVVSEPYQDFKMEKLHAAEEARHERDDVDRILESYDYSRPSSRRSLSTRPPSPRPSSYNFERDTKNKRVITQRSGTDPSHNRLSAASLSAVSMYSQVTGMPRRTPETRQPVRNARDLLPSRFSGTSYSTSSHSGPSVLPPSPPQNLLDDTRPPTPAQEYAKLVSTAVLLPTQPQDRLQSDVMATHAPLQSQYVPPRGNYWLQPTDTGETNASRNPFLRR